MIQRIAQAALCIAICLALWSGYLFAADPVRAVLLPSGERAAAEEIKLKDASGGTINLASYRGHVVLVDFWATYCGGCKQELPWFQDFQTKYAARKFAVLAVSMDHGGWEVVKPFIESLKIGFTVVLDDGDASQRYGLKAMPTAFLIDREGRVAAKYIGVVDRDNLESNIRLLLAEK